MHTKNQKKTYLSQSSCGPLDAIIVSHVHKTTRPLSKELRTCPECKNRYAKNTCIKALSHGAIFLATCNAILLLVDVKLANTIYS